MHPTTLLPLLLLPLTTTASPASAAPTHALTLHDPIYKPSTAQTSILCFANKNYIQAIQPFTRAYAMDQIISTCQEASAGNNLDTINDTIKGGIQITLTTMKNINSGKDDGSVPYGENWCEQGFTAAMDNCDTGTTQFKHGGAVTMFGTTFSIFGQTVGTAPIGK